MQKPFVLIDKFLNHDLSDQEREVLLKWVRKNKENRAIFKEHIRTFDVQTVKEGDFETAYKKFLHTIETKNHKRKKRVVLYRYAAVLIGLLIISGIGQYLIKNNFGGIPNTPIVQENAFPEEQGQIVLTLADGRTKTITPSAKETVRDEQGNSIANTTNGFLQLGNTNIKEVQLNEIFIPFGSTYKVQLSDGTMVWLNAGSTLKFPQNFVNSPGERMVYLEGEAFFDVTKDTEKPFIVSTRDLNVKVLGTQFNISSYTTDKTIKTTLVEGAVNVFETHTPGNQLHLTPNQQAAYHKNQKSFDKLQVDTDIYTAWMDHKLIINHLEFPEILKKLERFRNVRIINNAKHLNQEVYKGEFENESVETILNTIALSTPFTYEIKNKVITIGK